MTNCRDINKFIRYFFSGYLFERASIIDALNKPNVFECTSKSNHNIKMAVYTVNTGGYDNVISPDYVDDYFDYYIVTDNDVVSDVWKKISIPNQIKHYSLIEQSRYLKFKPHMLFPDYDYSLYIDGNVLIKKDLRPIINAMIDQKKVIGIHKHPCRNCIYDEARIIYAMGRAGLWEILKQIGRYKIDGFPKHFGLYENNIILRKHNDDECKMIMNLWWDEFLRGTRRDQLSFVYSLWKNNKQFDYVFPLGTNSRNSDFFNVVSHKKC